jgi:hypothetical protein
MLLDRAWTDVEVFGYLFVAAPLREQAQDFSVAWSDFDGVKIDHESAPE